jgi:Zn-dependent peptidase ImmA (M78 family)
MRWVPDKTGRLRKRPHYTPVEIDQACEAMVTQFLVERYGHATFPISTNDLTILVEQEVDQLDLYAEFQGEDRLLQGRTTFFQDSGPLVEISRELHEDPKRENRLRTTLTHELGHVKFQRFLWSHGTANLSFLGDDHAPLSPRCTGETLLDAKQSDWMEWQAGYASGAFLMPISAVYKVYSALLTEENLIAPLGLSQHAAGELLVRVQLGFRVSEEAARVRLLKLGFLRDRPGSQRALPLFGTSVS